MAAGFRMRVVGSVAVMQRISECGGVEIWQTSVSSMDNNCYLVAEQATGEGILIDAADDAAEIERLLSAPDFTVHLAAIVTTHTHWDHIRALREVQAATDAPAVAGAGDEGELPVAASHVVKNGDRIRFGEHEIEVVHLGGHTPGSIALVLDIDGCPTQLFTGDGLFPSGVGKTDGAKNFAELLGNVETRLFEWFDDDARVNPGHGDATTLGAERPHLAEWRERGW